MKLAFVCPDDFSATLFCTGLVDALKREGGTSVCTITGRFDEFENYRAEIKSWGTDHVNVSMYRFFNPIRDARYLFSLFKIYREKKFDVAVHWTTKPNIYGPISARLAGVKRTVMAIRGLGSVFQGQPNFKGSVLKTALIALYRLSCRLSDVVWFTNAADLKYFVDTGIVDEKKTVLTRNAINVAYYSMDAIDRNAVPALRKELNLGEHDKVVVMVARMIWPKGIIILPKNWTGG